MPPHVIEGLEIGANIATILAVPFGVWGIWCYLREQKNEAQTEEEKIYLQLTRSYDAFFDQMLQHPDVFHADWITDNLEQEARRRLLFERLISSLEQAYILLFATPNRGDSDFMKRLQASWNDSMHFWCQRLDFRTLLPVLLEGEDPDFRAHLMRIHDRVVRDLERKKGRESVVV